MADLLREAADDTDIDVSSISVVREALASNVVLVASYGSILIGCIMATPGPTAILHNLAIVPDQRRRGHATNLIGSIVDLLQKEGRVDTFWTAVDPRLPDGMRRFERHGFSAVPGMTCRKMTLMTKPATPPVLKTALVRKPCSLPLGTTMIGAVTRDVGATG